MCAHLLPPSFPQVAGPPFKQSERVVRSTPAAPAVVEHLLASLHLRTVQGTNTPAGALSAACVMHVASPAPRQVPCMVQVQREAGSDRAFVVTVATADAAATEALRAELAQLLAEL